MKAFIIMEQKEFEEAIERFTVKVIEDNGLVEYQISRKPKTTLIDLRTYVSPSTPSTVIGKNISLRNPTTYVRPFIEDPNHKPRKTRKARGCFTPDGTFDSIVDAARFYNIDKGLMCCRVSARVKKNVPGWGFIKHD